MNSDKVKKGRGGARPGAGRPAIDSSGQKRDCQVLWRLTREEAEKVKQFIRAMRESKSQEDW